MAASSFFNRIKYTPASAGTGDFVTSAAVAGFRTPATASIPNGTLVSYVAFSSDQSEWETGQGAYTSGTTTLARTTIRESSNAGSKVNFTAAPTVALDFQAQDAGLLAPLASPTFTGTVTVPAPFTLGAVSVTATGTQLNYLASATGTTGTTSTNVVFSTSPSLVTPALGVATATSVAIAGATIGTNALAVTGTVLFNNTLTVNGNSTFSLSSFFIDGSTGFNRVWSGGYYGWANTSNAQSGTTDTTISRNAAGIIQFGTNAANAAGSWMATNGTLSGSLTVAGISITGAGSLQVPGASLIYWNGRTISSSPVDGNYLLQNNAQTDFGRIQFGGTTPSFPAIKRSATILQAKLADDSAYAAFEATTLRTATAYTVATLPTAGTAGRRAYVTDALGPTYGVAVVGGGAVVQAVFDNGSNWLVM